MSDGLAGKRNGIKVSIYELVQASCFTFYRVMVRAYLTKLMTDCENAGNPVVIQRLKQHDEPLQVYVLSVQHELPGYPADVTTQA